MLGAKRPIDHDRCEERYHRREEIQVPNSVRGSELPSNTIERTGHFLAYRVPGFRGTVTHLFLHSLRARRE